MLIRRSKELRSNNDQTFFFRTAKRVFWAVQPLTPLHDLWTAGNLLSHRDTFTTVITNYFLTLLTLLIITYYLKRKFSINPSRHLSRMTTPRSLEVWLLPWGFNHGQTPCNMAVKNSYSNHYKENKLFWPGYIKIVMTCKCFSQGSFRTHDVKTSDSQPPASQPSSLSLDLRTFPDGQA